MVASKLIIIDGNSLMNRAFYALPPLTAKDGRQTNAVYGFCNIIAKIITEVKPTNMVVAFDAGKHTFRHNLYAEYKGTRHGMPNELAEQMPLIKEVLQSMGIKILEKLEIEADDIIGTIAKRFDCKTIIVTGDRDALQLVDKTTDVWLTKKGISEIDYVNIDNFKEKYGLVPSQIIDLKGLMGDASDNIPGIPGVGEKTAHEFLGKYETVEGLYEHADEIGGAKGQKVRDGKELAFLSKTLATIKTDCDIECEFEETALKLPFSYQTKQLFEELQFNSILKREKFFEENDNFEQDNSISVEQIEVNSLLELVDVLDNNKNCDKLAIINQEDKIYFAFEKQKQYCTDIAFYGYFVDILNNKDVKKVFYNAKIIHKELFKSIEKFENFFDVLLASHLVSGETRTPIKLQENLQEFGYKQGVCYALLNAYEILSEKLQATNMLELYNNIELPIIEILYNMEKQGIKIDRSILNELEAEYNFELKKLEQSIYEIAGIDFNINSPKQLSELLFDKLAIPTTNNTKKSTSYDILIKLENEHPIIPLLIRYRKISKLVSTYLDGFEKYIQDDEIIHTEYEQTMTATGRLSSNNPNLQNIPVKDDDGKILRKMFVPRNKDSIFVGADYSQIELRLMAHYSQDSNLLSAFNSGKDVHTQTASEIFDVEFDKVTESMRRTAKRINFGIIYGMSDYGLGQTLNIPTKLAREYMQKYFLKYPKVKEYSENIIETARKNGYVETMFGRKRYIPELQSSNKRLDKFGERVALNTPLQGTGSEIIKLAMIATEKALRKNNLKAQIILQIHDELIIECPQIEKEIVEKILKENMENVVKLRVPLPISLESGKSWFEI